MKSSYAQSAGSNTSADQSSGDGPFTLSTSEVALPQGAFSAGERQVLRHGDRPILAMTAGPYRPYLHPVWSPQGFVVTAERPADHPHHSGIWCAADHVALAMKGPDRVEPYDYNFYLDTVFQGRAPGQIRQTALTLAAQTSDTAQLEQQLTWAGPSEWGAANGRPVLDEQRTMHVMLRPEATIIDIACTLSCASDRPVTIGPTRHAYFNARLADGIALMDDAQPRDDRGGTGAAQLAPDARWVDFTGPVGGNHRAGIVVEPHERDGAGWFVADWGVVTVGPMKTHGLTLEPGSTLRMGCRFLVHDGTADIDTLTEACPRPADKTAER